ncbi:hypothetical protein KC949_02870 [Candidatus Saccharibacteria bacterium]|nr:hypothetical protein [Candidatus Saccharibacteria bacterium]
MFRKLVSNLPYSPSLISEIGFYARRLKNEDVTRRLTALFIVLTFVMQSLAVFSPVESVNASSEQDIIRGGVSDLDDFLVRYDHNEDDLKDILSTVGVSRDEVANTRKTTIRATSDMYMMSRFGQLMASDKEISMSYQKSTGGMDVRFFSKLTELDGAHQSFKGWVGQSASLGWFGILQSNGSLVTHGIPATFKPAAKADSNAIKTISARNITQGAPSESVKANPLDKIQYTLTLSNPQPISTSGGYELRIADILEYASLVDAGGADYNPTTKTISWPSTQLKPGSQQDRVFIVQMLDSFPETGQGSSNPESYDCKILAVFGNSHETKINCPMAKGIEGFLNSLPLLGSTGNIIFISVVALVVLFFAIRTSQMKKELRIIRHSFNNGVI